MWDINADAACSLYSMKRKRTELVEEVGAWKRERKVWTEEVK